MTRRRNCSANGRSRSPTSASSTSRAERREASAEPDPELVRAELEARVEWARSHEHVYDIAVWQLVAGRAEEGLESLRATVTGGVPAVDPRWAVVSGELERAARAAAHLLQLSSDDFVAGYREYVRALYAVIANDDEAASASLEELRAVGQRRRGGAPAGAVDVLSGLVDGSPEALEAGVDALLGLHVRRARARSEIFNSARAVVSLDAVVALLLAHRRGISVHVREAYRATTVPLLVIHVDERRGEQLRLRTDLVAGDWLRIHGLSVYTRPGGTLR